MTVSWRMVWWHLRSELVFLDVGLLVFVGFSEFLQGGLSLLWFISLTANCENVEVENLVSHVGGSVRPRMRRWKEGSRFPEQHR